MTEDRSGAHRLRLSGPEESRQAGLDRLHVWTEVSGVLLDDVSGWIVSCEGELPGFDGIEGLEVEALPPPSEAELAITGLEDDRAFEAAPGVWVRPPWVALPEGITPETELVVPRGGAFGSGEHGSTRAALALLHSFWPAEPPACFVDVGTGSGILALYAAVRGARRIEACDIEEASVRAARELLPADRSEVSVGGPEGLSVGAGDVVVANLDHRQIAAALDEVVLRVRPGGLLVVSGMRPHQTGVVERLGTALGCRQVDGYVGFAWRCPAGA